MPYWQLFYHIIWATKRRQPLLTPDVEPAVHGFIRKKAVGLGATVFALNGVEDHVHLVAAIPPRIAVAKFVGQIKGVAATRFNKSQDEVSLYWQEGYGVFSFNAKRLPNYVTYVERQKEHHATERTIPVLERLTGDAPRRVRDHTGAYRVDQDEWWRAFDTV